MKHFCIQKWLLRFKFNWQDLVLLVFYNKYLEKFSMTNKPQDLFWLLSLEPWGLLQGSSVITCSENAFPPTVDMPHTQLLYQLTSRTYYVSPENCTIWGVNNCGLFRKLASSRRLQASVSLSVEKEGVYLENQVRTNWWKT